MNFANSHLVTPNGAQIKLYNNPANIVAKKILPEGVVDYTYDSEYNLTRTTNADSDLSFTYDPLSRLIQAQTAGSVQPATSISYGYDLNSNLTSMTDPAGIVTNYVYDTLNRLAGITDSSDVYISSYTYDSLNRRVEKKLPNIAAPLTTSYTYDLASQLKSITNMPVNISNYYDNYDNVGNRLNMTDSTGTHNYTYDNLYRLTDSSNPSENYSYDPVGNRNPLVQAYDAGNRLLDDGTYTYNYDLNGNMTSKVKKIGGDTTTYTYNSEDQLIGVNGNISYKYDSLGRRIEKNVGGTITRYIYEGEDIIQELDGNNQVTATYTHGPGIDEPIFVEKAGQKYYYIQDGLGSVTTLVDTNGNIAQTYRYNSFGNIISQTGSLSQPYTYTGREYDSETGLFYYRARYYDPHIGRFLQEDPIGFAGGINKYAYVYNNPLNLVDPWGLRYYDYNFTFTPLGTGVGAVLGGILTFGNPLGIAGGAIIGSLGITGGVMYDPDTCSYYPYIGPALSATIGPTLSGMITYSSQNASRGLNVGLQYSSPLLAGGQIGYTFGNTGGGFSEIGGGYPQGGSVSLYYSFGPFKKQQKQVSPK